MVQSVLLLSRYCESNSDEAIAIGRVSPKTSWSLVLWLVRGSLGKTNKLIKEKVDDCPKGINLGTNFRNFLREEKK